MFKERFKELRELKGLTQSQLAKELNIGRTSISNYELGTRTPDIDILVSIANYFNVTTDYLTGISNFKTLEESIDFSKISNFFDDIIADIPSAPKKDTFIFIKKLLEFLNKLYKYDPKFYIDFFYSNYYLIDIFESMMKFIDSQSSMTLAEYKSVNEMSNPYPENKLSNKIFKKLNHTIDKDIFYSQMLALEKACPELFHILWDDKYQKIIEEINIQLFSEHNVLKR